MNEPPEKPDEEDQPEISPLSSELLAALQAHRAAVKKQPPPLKLAPGDALKQSPARGPKPPGHGRSDRGKSPGPKSPKEPDRDR
jgi:hypothetical protein